MTNQLFFGKQLMENGARCQGDDLIIHVETSTKDINGNSTHLITLFYKGNQVYQPLKGYRSRADYKYKVQAYKHEIKGSVIDLINAISADSNTMLNYV